MKTYPLLKKISLFFLCIPGLVSLSWAEEKENTRNPAGCNDVGYTFNLKTLHLLPHTEGGGQSLYVMYNKSQKPVTLFQMRDEESSYSMYFNHKINPGNWAILATCEKQMKYICTTADEKSAYGKIIDCQKNLQICEYNNVKFGLNNKGNYWLVNSNSKNAAVREVVRYGIIPAISQ